MTRHAKTHIHVYSDHPNPDWSTHVACTICGCTIPKTLLSAAITAGARYGKDENKS